MSILQIFLSWSVANTIIISLSILLLLAYFFDITSARTRIPSVILLLLLGWGLQQLTTFLEIVPPDLSPVLPIIGTIGLILIVMEGSLELEVDRSKIRLLKQAAFGGPLAILAMAFAGALVLSKTGPYPFKDSLTNVIPLCIISSAIAIPTAANLIKRDKEFVIYESSISDIFGVILFNFIALNEVIDQHAFLDFGLDLVLMIIVSLIATIGLSLLLNRISHPVKFVPIVLLMVLIYATSKIYHLPSLLFIMVFGLFIGNAREISQLKMFKRFSWDELDKEVNRFEELITEITFLVRSVFFLLFGFLLKTSEVLDPSTFIWSAGIVVLIYGIRALQLWVSGLPMLPLLFIAPRGLITILLFLSISPNVRLSIINNSLITQVIVLSALIMMVGMIGVRKEKELKEPKEAAPIVTDGANPTTTV